MRKANFINKIGLFSLVLEIQVSALVRTSVNGRSTFVRERDHIKGKFTLPHRKPERFGSYNPF